MSKVPGNLRAILNMTNRLDTRALDLANSPLMPGGEAMVNLAHVANLGDWERRNELASHELTTYEDPAKFWSPFQLLRFWSEQWRSILGMDYDEPTWFPSLRSEAGFLANPDVLSWAWDNEPKYDDFATDVASAKTRLEGILREGERPDRIRVVCPDCTSGKRLIIRYGETEAEDTWKCPAAGCKHRFDADAVRRAYAKQLRGEGAARWVTLADAVSILSKHGWRDETIRSWADAERVEVATDDTGRLFVWWPDIWRVNLTRRHARDEALRVARDRAERKATCAEQHGEDCWAEGHQGKPGQRGCARSLDRTTAV